MPFETLTVFSEFLGRGADDLGGENKDGDILIIKWANNGWPMWNNLSLNGPNITPSNLRSSLASAAEYMRSHSYPGFLWLFEETFNPEVWDAIPQTLSSVGLNTEFPGICMTLEPDDTHTDPYLFPEPSHPDLTFKRAATPSDLHHIADLNSKSYSMTIESGRAGFQTEFYVQHNYAYIAFVGDTPVATASTAQSEDLLFVTYVATDPEFRGKGYARAVVMKAIREGVKGTGLRRVILHATIAGSQVYSKIGFKSTGDMLFIGLKKGKDGQEGSH